MAQPWMRAKLAKQVGERREDRARANDRANWEMVHKPRYGTSNGDLIEAYFAADGAITKCNAGKRPRPIGKNKRCLDTRTFGRGARIQQGITRAHMGPARGDVLFRKDALV